MSYDDILNTKGTKDDKYTRSKSAVFAMLYGGEGYTLMTRLGVPIEVADAAYQRFTGKYKKVGEERRKVFEMFCSMRQTGGIGIEGRVARAGRLHREHLRVPAVLHAREHDLQGLFSTWPRTPPKHWRDLKVKVVRRDRQQTAAGAVQSALFGAAFQIQAGNMRAAANHVIQSAGATVTKHLQRQDLGHPAGGRPPVRGAPHERPRRAPGPVPSRSTSTSSTTVVHDTVESFRPRVPLIGIDWGNGLGSLGRQVATGQRGTASRRWPAASSPIPVAMIARSER